MFRLLRMERYVLSRSLTGVLGAGAIISSIVILINFIELARNFTNRDASFLTLLAMTLMRSPQIILQLLPFVFLFGTLAAFVSLNRRSELVAMRAAGVSAWRFILPAAAAAFAVGVATVVALNPLATRLEAGFEQVRASLNPRAAEQPRIWLRQGDDHSQTIIGAGSREEAGSVLLKNVSFFVYTVDAGGTPQFSRRIEADTARLLKGSWRLTHAREATPGGAATRYDSLSIPTNLTYKSALEHFASPETISFWELPSTVSRIEKAGFSATNYRLRLQQLLAIPFLFAAMSILAAVFSLKLMRLGGLAVLAGTGVATGFGFFFFDKLCASLGKAEVVPPFAAAWITPILAILTAFTLLFYTEDG